MGLRLSSQALDQRREGRLEGPKASPAAVQPGVPDRPPISPERTSPPQRRRRARLPSGSESERPGKESGIRLQPLQEKVCNGTNNVKVTMED